MGCGVSINQTSIPKVVKKKQIKDITNTSIVNTMPLFSIQIETIHEPLTDPNTKVSSPQRLGTQLISCSEEQYQQNLFETYEIPEASNFSYKDLKSSNRLALTIQPNTQQQSLPNYEESPIQLQRFLSYQSASSLVSLGSITSKRKNLIDLMREKTSSCSQICQSIESADNQTVPDRQMSQTVYPSKKQDLIQLMRSKNCVSSPLSDSREQIIQVKRKSSKKKTSLLRRVSEIKEDMTEQSSMCAFDMHSPNLNQIESLSDISSLDDHKQEQLFDYCKQDENNKNQLLQGSHNNLCVKDNYFWGSNNILGVKDYSFLRSNNNLSSNNLCVRDNSQCGSFNNLNVKENSFLDLSNQNLSFMVNQDDLNKLNFDKYSLRLETIYDSYEQQPQLRQFLSNKSIQVVARKNSEIVQEQNVLYSTHLCIPESGSKTNHQQPQLRKTLSTYLEQSPTDKYLSPQSRTSRIASNSHIRASTVMQTTKMEKSFDESGNKKINDYVILHMIGRGGFGKVKKVYNATTKEIFAIKIANKAKLKKKMLGRNKSAYTFLEQEIAILKKMDHPNIVKLHEVIDDPDNDKLYLIMDFIEGGAVNSKIYWLQTDKTNICSAGQLIGEPKIRINLLKKYLRNFLVGLHYLHNVANVIHRDIKPDNLLIDKYDTLKIADFGVAMIIEQTEDISGDTGTKAFLPPESFEGKMYNGKAQDIWSAGVCFYFLATGLLPFKAKKLEELKQLVLYSNPEYPDFLEPEFIDLIQQCLTKQQSQRISLDGLIMHPWVTDNGTIQIINYDEAINHIIISDSDVKQALSGLTLKSKVKITAKLKLKLNQSRIRLKKQKN